MNTFQLNQRRIESECQRAGMGPVGTALASGLAHWYTMYDASDDHRIAQREYLGTFGFSLQTPKLELPCSTARAVYHKLLSELVHERDVDASNFVKVEHLAALCPELPERAVQELSECLQRAARLGKLKLPDLHDIYPVPVCGPTTVGLFIHNYDAGPEAALRHVKVAQAGFHVFRDLAEWALDGAENAATFSTNRTGLGVQGTRITEKDTFEMASLVVKRAAEILGRPGASRPVDIIEFPELPYVPIVDPERSAFITELETDIVNWLIDDAREGEALTRNWIAATSFGGGKKNRPYQVQTPSALEELDAAEGLPQKMKKFRAELLAARANNHRIFFSLRKLGADVVRGDRDKREVPREQAFRLILDHVFKRDGDKLSENAALIRDARWLTTPDVGSIFSTVSSAQRHDPDDEKPAATMSFSFGSSDLAWSARAILSAHPIPEHVLKREEFRERVIAATGIEGYSGGSGRKRFERLCEKNFGKDFTPAQEVEALFNLCPHIDQARFLNILSLLSTLGVGKITERAELLAKKKYYLQADIPLTSLATFAEHAPKTVGSIPTVFERLDTFDTYSKLGVKPFGVKKESAALSAALKQSNVVLLVDQQFYNQDLVPEIFGVRKAQDVEPTHTIWGNYVRGGGRAMLALVRDVVDGKLEELKDWCVVRPQTDHRLVQAYEEKIRKVFDFDLRWTVDMALVNEVMGSLTTYSEKTVLFVDAASAKSLDQLKAFLKLVEDLGIKTIVRSRENIPGIPAIMMLPWSDEDVARRIKDERKEFSEFCGLEVPITEELIDFASMNVHRFRQTQDDPLHLTALVLELAALRATTLRATSMHESDITEAVATVFKLPDITRTRQILQELEIVKKNLPKEVAGQEPGICEVLSSVQLHLSGARDQGRPLSILLPGPTGVGKTETLMRLARYLSIPFYHIEGTRFGEEHSHAILLGSPSGYVGPDEGPLFEFADRNTIGIVFADEFEKMHSKVNEALMNFVDVGSLTAGNGRQVHRPGLIIVGATNAGADRIVPNVSVEQLHDILKDHYKCPTTGKSKPELVKRWNIVPFPPLDRAGFRQVLTNTLEGVATRPGFLGANLGLLPIDADVVDVLQKECLEVCRFKPARGIGLKTASDDGSNGLFYDMRYPAKALDRLLQAELNRVIKEAHESGAALSRESRTKLRLRPTSDKKGLKLVSA